MVDFRFKSIIKIGMIRTTITTGNQQTFGWYAGQGVVPLLFTLLPLAIMQNFSLHNATDSIYN